MCHIRSTADLVVGDGRAAESGLDCLVCALFAGHDRAHNLAVWWPADAEQARAAVERTRNK